MFCNKCGSELNENGECLNCKRKEESEKSKLENEIKPKIKKKKVKLYFYPDLLLYSLFYVFMH